jgi:hypothetical protein
MTYTIEETGLGGWMSYRYQYKAGAIDRFGYAETREEALKNIKEGGGGIMDDKQLENDFIEAIKSSSPNKESLNAFEEMLASGKLIIVS